MSSSSAIDAEFNQLATVNYDDDFIADVIISEDNSLMIVVTYSGRIIFHDLNSTLKVKIVKLSSGVVTSTIITYDNYLICSMNTGNIVIMKLKINMPTPSRRLSVDIASKRIIKFKRKIHSISHYKINRIIVGFDDDYAGIVIKYSTGKISPIGVIRPELFVKQCMNDEQVFICDNELTIYNTVTDTFYTLEDDYDEIDLIRTYSIDGDCIYTLTDTRPVQVRRLALDNIDDYNIFIVDDEDLLSGMTVDSDGNYLYMVTPFGTIFKYNLCTEKLIRMCQILSGSDRKKIKRKVKLFKAEFKRIHDNCADTCQYCKDLSSYDKYDWYYKYLQLAWHRTSRLMDIQCTKTIRNMVMSGDDRYLIVYSGSRIYIYYQALTNTSNSNLTSESSLTTVPSLSSM